MKLDYVCSGCGRKFRIGSGIRTICCPDCQVVGSVEDVDSANDLEVIDAPRKRRGKSVGDGGSSLLLGVLIGGVGILVTVILFGIAIFLFVANSREEARPAPPPVQDLEEIARRAITTPPVAPNDIRVYFEVLQWEDVGPVAKMLRSDLQCRASRARAVRLGVVIDFPGVANFDETVENLKSNQRYEIVSTEPAKKQFQNIYNGLVWQASCIP